MKKIVITLAVFLIAALAWLSSTFTAATLDVGPTPRIETPTSNVPASMSVKAMSTGHMLSKAGLAFRGGDLSEKRVFAMNGALIQHPKGTVLIDAGFASNVDEHFASTPKLMQLTSSYEAGIPIAQQLTEHGIDQRELTAVILTHAHWDHVSGLADLPSTPVWVTQAELSFVQSDAEPAALARSIGTNNYSVMSFKKESYLGFEQSFDVFDDGSVVVVPAAGHTPGSVIVFVTLPNQNRYAFIGDLAWQQEGIDWPSEKPWLPRTLVGEDQHQVSRLLVHIHHLQNAIPQLQIIPAHDQQAWERLPK